MGYVNSILIITAWIASVIFTGIACKVRWPKQKELSRKIIHIGIGPVLPLAWWLSIPKNLAIPITIGVTIALLINHRWRFLPGIEDVNRNSYGTVAYGLTFTILIGLFWPSQPDAASAGVLVMAFGDGLAGLIGRNIQSKSWMILNQRKSIAGTLTMAIVTLLVLPSLNFLAFAELQPIQILAITALAIGLEQISRWGLDNFTVPLGIAFTWTWMTNIQTFQA